jgi:hypothetical protein
MLCCAVLCDAVLLLQTIITKVKTYHKVLQAFVTNAKLELTLLVTLQVCVLAHGGHCSIHAENMD